VWEALQLSEPLPQEAPLKILVSLQNTQTAIKTTQATQPKEQPRIEPTIKQLQPIMPKPPIEPVVPINRKIIETPILPAPAAKEVSQPAQQTVATPSPAPTKPVIAKTPEAVAPPPPKQSYTDEHLGTIRTILQERLVYPKMAIRLRQQGEVKMGFSLSPSGEVSDISIESSSGFSLLDSAAEKLIKESASEFPKPHQKVRISIPIGYRLR